MQTVDSVHKHSHGENCIHSAALDAVRQGHPEVRKRLLGAFAITAMFMLVEVVGGLLANSLALLADAGHMLTDAGALALALMVASWNARQSGNPALHARFERRSVGTIVAALLIREFGWLAADPIASLLVSALVLRAAFSLLRDAWRVILRASVERS